MSDPALVHEILRQLLQATSTINYFDLDAEVVYNVCEVHIPALAATLEKMQRSLDKQ